MVELAVTTVRVFMVRIKRTYERAAAEDGYRVLVDRLWPRGMKKTALRMDEWAKEVAPSDKLRRAFRHTPQYWKDFQTSYRMELRQAQETLQALAERARKGTLTLLYSARDKEHNNAIVLKRAIEAKAKDLKDKSL